MRSAKLSITLALFLATIGLVDAGVPKRLSFQGQLTDAMGTPIVVDTELRFTVFVGGTAEENPSTGRPVYQEDHTVTPDAEGVFSHIIGTGTVTSNCDEDADGTAGETCDLTADDFPGSSELLPVWLEVRVDPAGADNPLLPRQRVVSVGYALNSARLDGQAGDYFLDTSSTAQTKEGSLILNGPLRMNANVRIFDSAELILEDEVGNNPGHLVFRTSTEPVGRLLAHPGGLRIRANDARDSDIFIDHDDGQVGIGTSSPTVPLHVIGNARVEGALRLDLDDDVTTRALSFKGAPTGTTEGYRIRWDHAFFGSALDAAVFEKSDSNNLDPDGGIAFVNTGSDGVEEPALVIRGNGRVGVNTIDPVSKFHVEGTVTTKILQITGGSDIAEPFPVIDGEAVAPGAVLAIDSDRAGWLRVSSRAYDSRVAGVVSGAGGVNPGLILTQQDTFSGDHAVALTGRAYVMASASNGAIEPGDLLTTAEIPGHAMKATDTLRSQGATLGKAMSSLDEGRGLVLVLINLQ